MSFLSGIAVLSTRARWTDLAGIWTLHTPTCAVRCQYTVLDTLQPGGFLVGGPSLYAESSVSGRGRAPCSVNESAGVRHSLDPGEARTERCAGAQLGPPSVFHSTCELGLQGCPSGPHGP